MGHHPPSRPRPHGLAQAIEHCPSTLLPLGGVFRHPRHIGGYQAPFLITHLTRIGSVLPLFSLPWSRKSAQPPLGFSWFRSLLLGAIVSSTEEALAKSRLAQGIAEIIEKQHLTQVQAAALLGSDQPKVSKLLRGQLREFSTDRLFRFLNALDQDVEIVVKHKPRSRR